MGDHSAIQWTDSTWNPVTGCSKVSPGCRNCYAERLFPRAYKGREFTDVQCHPERLDQPLRWKKPRHVFVNSMSDLFHESVPCEFIAKVFATMRMAHQHKFQVLTKRPERILRILQGESWLSDFDNALGALTDDEYAYEWPLPNVWLGVSVENQATADERIPILLQTPAAVRFLSVEPLLESVDLGSYLVCRSDCPIHGAGVSTKENPGCCDDCGEVAIRPGIDWVIVGGESGPRARPCSIDWIRSIVAQCKAAEVPCFVKQLGSCPTYTVGGDHDVRFGKLRDSHGADPEEWPADLRIREFPA